LQNTTLATEAESQTLARVKVVGADSKPMALILRGASQYTTKAVIIKSTVPFSNYGKFALCNKL